MLSILYFYIIRCMRKQMKEMIYMRCGIYVRVSTDEQRYNGYSIDSQQRMIKEYCEKNNYQEY